MPLHKAADGGVGGQREGGGTGKPSENHTDESAEELTSQHIEMK